MDHPNISLYVQMFFKNSYYLEVDNDGSVALSYHRVHRLYFLADIFVRS